MLSSEESLGGGRQGWLPGQAPGADSASPCGWGEGGDPMGVCRAGKVLDELLQSCVDPEDCPTCEVAGRRLAPGKKITLNPSDPEHCQIW